MVKPLIEQSRKQLSRLNIYTTNKNNFTIRPNVYIYTTNKNNINKSKISTSHSQVVCTVLVYADHVTGLGKITSDCHYAAKTGSCG